MRAVLEAAKRQLTEKMRGAGREGLVLLLARSFPYIGVPELRDIPLSIITQLQPVPPEFLSQLAKDNDLFTDLPASVQNQVKLLEGHSNQFLVGIVPSTRQILPLVIQHGGETARTALPAPINIVM